MREYITPKKRRVSRAMTVFGNEERKRSYICRRTHTSIFKEMISYLSTRPPDQTSGERQSKQRQQQRRYHHHHHHRLRPSAYQVRHLSPLHIRVQIPAGTAPHSRHIRAQCLALSQTGTRSTCTSPPTPHSKLCSSCTSLNPLDVPSALSGFVIRTAGDRCSA